MGFTCVPYITFITRSLWVSDEIFVDIRRDFYSQFNEFRITLFVPFSTFRTMLFDSRNTKFLLSIRTTIISFAPIFYLVLFFFWNFQLFHVSNLLTCKSQLCKLCWRCLATGIPRLAAPACFPQNIRMKLVPRFSTMDRLHFSCCMFFLRRWSQWVIYQAIIWTVISYLFLIVFGVNHSKTHDQIVPTTKTIGLY